MVPVKNVALEPDVFACVPVEAQKEGKTSPDCGVPGQTAHVTRVTRDSSGGA